MLYHKIHWGPQGGQNCYWGRPSGLPPFEPPLEIQVSFEAILENGVRWS